VGGGGGCFPQQIFSSAVGKVLNIPLVTCMKQEDISESLICLYQCFYKSAAILPKLHETVGPTEHRKTGMSGYVCSSFEYVCTRVSRRVLCDFTFFVGFTIHVSQIEMCCHERFHVTLRLGIFLLAFCYISIISKHISC
jgi:hypothetical protein